MFTHSCHQHKIGHKFVSFFPGAPGMFATWRITGNEVLEAVLCFGPAVTQWTRQGQCTWRLTEQKWVSIKETTGKGGNCVKAKPLFLSAHVLIFLHTPLIPFQSFWVMSCCGRAVGTPSWRDGIKAALSDSRVHMPRKAQWEGKIKLIRREERTTAVSNKLTHKSEWQLTSSPCLSYNLLKQKWAVYVRPNYVGELHWHKKTITW